METSSVSAHCSFFYCVPRVLFVWRKFFLNFWDFILFSVSSLDPFFFLLFVLVAFWCLSYFFLDWARLLSLHHQSLALLHKSLWSYLWRVTFVNESMLRPDQSHPTRNQWSSALHPWVGALSILDCDAEFTSSKPSSSLSISARVRAVNSEVAFFLRPQISKELFKS